MRLLRTQRITGLVIAALFAPLAASADITSNLVGHWQLEEGSGTTANDSSGEGNHGDLVGDPLPDWVAGWEGTGLEFFWDPGVANNGVEVSPSPISFERDEPFSMALWLKRLESEDGYLLANQGVSFEGMALLLSASDSAEMPTDDSLTFRLRDTNSGIDVSLGNGVLAGSDWHHVVVTYDGSSDADGVLFYIDGQSSAVASVNEDALDGSSDAGEPFYFGLSDVVVDDVRLYDRVLSSGDVTELYGAEEEEEAPPRTIILDASIIQIISGKIVILANGEGGGAGPVYEEEAPTEWTPLELGADLMAWLPLGELDGMWQDSAATTPVTSDNDPIGRAEDRSSNARDGVQSTSSAQPHYRTGSPAYAEFATNDYLAAGSDYSSTAFGFSAWVYRSGSQTDGTPIFDFWQSPYAGRVTFVGNKISLQWRNSSGTDMFNLDSSFYIQDPNVLPADTWTHVAVNVSGAGGEIYINGALVRSQSAATTIRNPGVSSIPLNIGKKGDSSTYFNGRLRHAVVVDRLLTQDEIDELAAMQ